MPQADSTEEPRKRRIQPERDGSDRPATGAAEAPPPRLHLLGRPRLERAGFAAQTLSDKDAAMLAVLALDGPQARGALCALLWPSADANDAAVSLRQRAKRLSDAAGRKMLQLGASVSLDTSVPVDVARLDTLTSVELLRAGVLLAGCDLGELGEMDVWLQQARHRVAKACADRLADFAENLEREGRLHEALNYARRVNELVPLSEHGARRVMRLHYLRQDRAAAREEYRRISELLQNEFGRRPSAETLQLLQTVDLAEVGPGAKGRPVPASVLRPPILIGRDAPWAAMVLAWQHGQPFLLVGAAGLGKTRLLEECQNQTQGSVTVRAQPGDEDTPLSLLGRLLVEIERTYAPSLAENLRLELSRIRAEFGTSPAVPSNAQLIRHAVEQYLAAAMPQGLQAILLDDLHNADAATLGMLRWLSASHRLQALRWGLASRPGHERPESALGAWLLDSYRPARVELQPLALVELSALLASLALPVLVDVEMTRQLFRHAGGHPFFTLATLQHALATGADMRAEVLPHPSSVHALLDERVRQLPEGALNLLRVAAVAGPDLRADRVARMQGCGVLDLAQDWAVLEAAGMFAGEAFAHDLMQECAGRAVPAGVRIALHRRFAAVLLQDPSALPSQIARHYEAGEVWDQAARHWVDAAKTASRRACLMEQIGLFDRAARCFERAGDSHGRCEALLGRLSGLQKHVGGHAVLEALPQAETLAATGLQRLHCRLVRAEVLVDMGQTHGLAEAEAAVREAESYPALLADAQTQLAQALAQVSRFEAARRAAELAHAVATSRVDDAQQLRALHALAYVAYSEGRLADALAWQTKGVAMADDIGYRAEAAAGAGHVAALLGSIGDVPESYAQAIYAQRRHRDVGVSGEGTFGIVNRIVLGSAAAAMGRYDEALDALREVVSDAEREAAPAALAKAGLALAALWLTLGSGDMAGQLLDELSPNMTPGLSMQVCLLRARAAQQAGRSPRQHLLALGEIDRRHPGLPLVMSAHFEASYQADAADMVIRLDAAQADCAEKGLYGTSRTLQWRALVRRLELVDRASSQAPLSQARALHDSAESGLSAKCYPPQVWATLACDYARAGESALQEACTGSALTWIDRAAARVPPAYREGFLRVNRVNRLLLSGDWKGTPGVI